MSLKEYFLNDENFHNLNTILNLKRKISNESKPKESGKLFSIGTMNETRQINEPHI